ncbi:MAG: VWA domain-containing protein [Colwellia sp.]|nr:VWA domain-containing protein [Colwellia sp.]
MRDLSFLCSMVILFFLASTVSATIQYPNGKPEEPMAAPYGHDHWFVVVVKNTINIYDSPQIEGEHRVLEDQWLNVYVIGDKVEDFYLVMSLDANAKIKEYYGWVKGSDLQYTAYALKNSNMIYKKALVVNHWRTVQKGMVQDLHLASVYNSIDQDRKEIGELSLFDIYFIFQEQTGQNGETFYLIGSNPKIPNFRNPSRFLIGWLSSDRVLNWDTKQALYFKKTNFDNRRHDEYYGAIFQIKSEDNIDKYHELKSWYLGGNRPSNIVEGAPMGLESEKISSELPYQFPRFPILQKSEIISEFEGSILKIGYIGDIITKTGERVSNIDIQDDKAQLEELIEKFNNIDLHFVLDTTLTMGPAFEKTKKALERTISILDGEFKELKKKVRFGLTMFKDFSDKANEGSYLIKRVKLQQDPSLLLSTLNNEIEKGGGSDAAEASFYAIQRSLELDEPDPNSIVAVFLITDAPNNNPPGGGYTVTKLVEKLLQFNALYFPVIKSQNKNAIDEATKTVELLMDHPLGYGKGEVVLADFGSTQTSDAMVGAIRKAFDDYKVLSKLLIATRDGSGHLDGEEFILGNKRFGVKMTARFAKIVKEGTGVDLNHWNQKVQIFEEGYILDKPENVGKYRLLKSSLKVLSDLGVQDSVIEKLGPIVDEKVYDEEEFFKHYIIGILTKQEKQLFQPIIMDVANMGHIVEYYVFCDKSTLLTILSLLDRMVSEPFDKGNVIKLWKKEVEVETHKDAETIADIIEKHMGLPVSEEILKKSFDELQGLDPEELSLIYEKLRLKRDKISDIISEQNVVYRTRDDGSTEYVNLGSKKYFWRNKSGKLYCWIKRSILP